MDSKLSQAGYDLALEIRGGKWSHVEDLRAKPASASNELLNELRGVFQGKQINNMLKLWQTASSTLGSLPNISFKADGFAAA